MNRKQCQVFMNYFHYFIMNIQRCKGGEFSIESEIKFKG